MGKCSIDSMYLCVRDMNRAIAFYERFLEMTVTERDSVYSVFDVNGFRLGLFAFERMNEPHAFGDNCLPSVRVENIGELRRKLAGRKTVFPVTRIGGNWVAELEDSEGNRIELTAPVGRPAPGGE